MELSDNSKDNLLQSGLPPFPNDSWSGESVPLEGLNLEDLSSDYDPLAAEPKNPAANQAKPGDAKPAGASSNTAAPVDIFAGLPPVPDTNSADKDKSAQDKAGAVGAAGANPKNPLADTTKSASKAFPADMKKSLPGSLGGGRAGSKSTADGVKTDGDKAKANVEASGSVDTVAAEHGPTLGRRFMLFMALPAWMVSMLVHMLMILVLALVGMNPEIPNSGAVLAVATPSDSDGDSEIQQFDVETMDPPAAVEENTSDAEPSFDVPSQVTEVQPVSVEAAMSASISDAASMDFSVQTFSTQSLSQAMNMSGAALGSRTAGTKKELLRRYGGTKESEAAVSEALKWIARHQLPNGGFTFEHTVVCNGKCGDPGDRTKAFNAATALAILPFLGAGQTHLQGEYKGVVRGGLSFLMNNMKVENQGLIRGSLHEAEGNMYSHGLASIALCEAYAMTEDPDLARHAQAAVNFIVYAQDPKKGGWRYTPRNDSDTSVVGWQLMALKSGYMAHLQIPPETFRAADGFLNFVSTNKGAYYGYDQPTTGKPPGTTAIGLLCRMYMGWDRNNPGLVEGVKYISQVGVNKKDIYYDYYAAQVLRHYGGPEWDKFNGELREWLVSTQDKQGEAKGSWYFADSLSHRGPLEGGRLASTAFATMILEVYYRHMPLYGNAAAEDDFKL